MKYKKIIYLIILFMLSCNVDPEIISLPDTTPPSGYVVGPQDNSSLSGVNTISVISVDNEEIDTVFFLIKKHDSNIYEKVDSAFQANEDLWLGNWDTRDIKYIEDEQYFITFKSVDISGNYYIGQPINVKINNQDDESPIGYIKNPLSGQIINGVEIIEIIATDNQALQYVNIYINNSLVSTILEPPFVYTWNTQNEVDDVVHSIYAQLVDIDNNITIIPPISVIVNNQLPTDFTPPTGAITSPPTGSTVSGQTLIQVSAVDDQMIDNIKILIDGQSVYTFYCGGPNCSAEIFWETDSIPDGEHSIQAIMKDGWNNTTISTAISVIVDNVNEDEIPPILTIISPSAGQVLSGIVMVDVGVYDNEGIEKVEFFINDTVDSYVDSIGPNYSFNWNTTGLDDDKNYIISAKGIDFIGNVGYATPITVYLDNVDEINPTGSIVYPFGGQTVTDTVLISINAIDDQGIKNVKFYINGFLKTTDFDYPYEYQWNTEIEDENQSYILYGEITDLSDNVYATQNIVVYVNNIVDDITPPVISIINPAPNQTVSGQVNFSVFASDNVEISYVEFYLDGISLGIIDESPFVLIWDTTDLSTGDHGPEHTLSAKAIDLAGNISFSQPILVIVAN